MTKPDKQLLRRFYSRCFGHRIPAEDLYDGVPFETYFQLMRTKHPEISRRTAAQNSRLEKYRSLAEGFLDEPSPAPMSARCERIRNKSVDLTEAAVCVARQGRESVQVASELLGDQADETDESAS